MCRKVMIPKARVNVMVLVTLSESTPARLKNGSNIFARKGSPTQPSARLERVMPSCVAERYASRCTVTWRANLARESPSTSSASSWLPRTLTIANSDATKKPLSSTRKRMTASWKKIVPPDSQCVATPSVEARNSGKMLIVDTKGTSRG